MSAEDRAFIRWLAEECHYITPVQAGNWWVACQQLLYHGSLIAGPMHDRVGYSFRYCYDSVVDAQIGLAEWASRDWEGEPVGWNKRKSAAASLI